MFYGIVLNQNPELYIFKGYYNCDILEQGSANTAHCLFFSIKFYWHPGPPIPVGMPLVTFTLQRQSGVVATEAVWFTNFLHLQTFCS